CHPKLEFVKRGSALDPAYRADDSMAQDEEAGALRNLSVHDLKHSTYHDPIGSRCCAFEKLIFGEPRGRHQFRGCSKAGQYEPPTQDHQPGPRAPGSAKSTSIRPQTMLHASDTSHRIHAIH